MSLPIKGWFSDRSGCYLAAGRPVIMQDTGFGNILSTGEGLFSFTNEDEAVAAIDAIAQNYERHSTIALEIAHEYFDAERVLGAILHKIGMGRIPKKWAKRIDRPKLLNKLFLSCYGFAEKP